MAYKNAVNSTKATKEEEKSTYSSMIRSEELKTMDVETLEALQANKDADQVSPTRTNTITQYQGRRSGSRGRLFQRAQMAKVCRRKNGMILKGRS